MYVFSLLPPDVVESHDDVIKWKHFPRNWPFVRGIHRSPVNSPHKWPVTRSFDVFFYLSLNKRFCKQSWGWWFETLSRSFWRHCNEGRHIREHAGCRFSIAMLSCLRLPYMLSILISYLYSNIGSYKLGTKYGYRKLFYFLLRHRGLVTLIGVVQFDHYGLR